MNLNVYKSPEISSADGLEKIDMDACNSEHRHVARDVTYSLYMISLKLEASPQLDAIDESIQLIYNKGQEYIEKDFLAITCMTCLEMTYGFELLSNPREAFHNLYLDSGISVVLNFLAQYLENLVHSPMERLKAKSHLSGFWIDSFLQSVFESSEK